MAAAATPSVAVPPGPAGVPILGVMNEFRRDPLELLTRCAREYGGMSRLNFMGWPCYLLAAPEHVDQVLGHRYREFKKTSNLQTPLLRGLFGQGLVTAEGDFWARQRQLVQPAFHRERIQAYAETMVEYTTRHTAAWRDGDTRDFLDEMMTLTLAIAARTLFHADVSRDAPELGRVLERMMHEFTRSWSLWGIVDYYLPLFSERRYRGLVRKLDEAVYGVIRMRRESGEDTGDLLSLLLSLRDDTGAGMTDRQLRDETLTFLFAGHETTALTLAWTIYLLSEHPEVEERLRGEVESVLGGRAPDASDVGRLEYTGWVVRESMRVYPAVWAVGREPQAALELAGYRLPARSTLMMSPWVTHRHPAYWEEPETFRPERWADDLESRLPRGLYFPFGSGPRACIGRGFAMMELVLVLATLYQRYRFTRATGGPIVPWVTMTLRPRGGVPVRVEAVRRGGGAV